MDFLNYVDLSKYTIDENSEIKDARINILTSKMRKNMRLITFSRVSSYYV